ncbi:MAG: agmatine deiminase family protein [Saprospiraceae bacterium]
MQPKHLFLLICLLFISNISRSQFITLNSKTHNTPFTPTGRPRMAAEWEPALGTLIAWPPSLPKKLITELAIDNKLFVLVEDRNAQKDAVTTFSKWGIMPNQVKFIQAPQGVDVSWTRDWGPHAVFTQHGTMKLADGRYLYATPKTGFTCDDSLELIYFDEKKQPLLTKTDDKIPDYIAEGMNLEIIHLPFVFTGGNVFTDGQRNGLSSCVLTNENRFSGVSDENFFLDVHQLLGLDNYHIISNFEESGIQHIDCLLKLLDEERIFVMRTPADHPLYEQYEGIVENELRYMKNAYGRPYQILRLDTDVYNSKGKLAAYSNSLILNKVVYVPLFGIPQDSIAMQQWREAMPGYTVKGFEFILNEEKVLSPDCRTLYKEIGWNYGDALHCRARAIWDPEMIYISVDRPSSVVAAAENYPIVAIIKDYSLQGLVIEKTKLMWRMKGKSSWNEIPLTKSQLDDHYLGTIQGEHLNHTIEYYITAQSLSGKTETMPRTAPQGLYEFKVEDRQKK